MQTRSDARALVASRINLDAIPEEFRSIVSEFFADWKPTEKVNKSDVLRCLFRRAEFSGLVTCSNEVIAAAVGCAPSLVTKVATEVSVEEASLEDDDPKTPGRKSYLTSEQKQRLRAWIRSQCEQKSYPSMRKLKEEILLELEQTRPDVCPTSSWYHYTIKGLLKDAFKLKHARPYEDKRYQLDKRVVAQYFELLGRPEVAAANPHMIYNTDETGFGASKSGRLKTQLVVVPIDMKEAPACEEPVESHFVTCIACASLDGRLLTPGLVTKRVTDHPDATGCSFYSHAIRYSSPKAFVNRGIFEHYFYNVIFADITKYRAEHPAESQMALVIMDGHKSHDTERMNAFCAQNGIILLTIPPHSSHLVQMLDRGVFRRAKTEFSNFPIDHSMSKISNALERCYEAYEACRVQAFLWRCWQHAGIRPMIESGCVVGFKVESEKILNDPAINHAINESAQGRHTESCQWGLLNENEMMIFEAGQCPFCCYPLEEGQ